MKKFLPLFIFLIVVCLGCSYQVIDKTMDASLVNYTRDNRTGLCYAYTGSMTRDGSVIYTNTCVPCNEEVLKLIK